MEFELELEIAHLWQRHEKKNMPLLDDVKLYGLGHVFLVVHAYNQLLVALGRLGVREGELRRSLGNVVPDATVGNMSLVQPLENPSLWYIPNPKPLRSE